jgi:hypothetical protein
MCFLEFGVMERVLFTLESIEKKLEFDIEIEYRINLDSDRDLLVFEARINQFMADCPLILTLEFHVLNRQISNRPIADFHLPDKLRGQRVAGFILNKIYELIPKQIKPYAFVHGSLSNLDKSPARDALYKKLIGLPASTDSKFIDSSEHDSGSFNGQFHDVGTSWKKSLRIKK